MTRRYPPVPDRADLAVGPQVETGRTGPRGKGRLRAAWTALTGATGVVMGIAPHVLHHVGPLVGTALIAGVAGKVVFGALGLVASIPMLVRLKRRFRSWWAPAVALGVFTAAFVVSTTVIGPLISGDGGQTDEIGPVGTVTPNDHDAHH